MRNSTTNQLNTSTQGKKSINTPTPYNNILHTNENSVYQQTKESNNSTFTKNSVIFGKTANFPENVSKGNNDTSATKSGNTNNMRLVSKSPKKNSYQNEKKASASNTTSLNKQVKRVSMPVTNTRSALNKTRDNDIDIIPFGDDNTGKLDFKSKASANKSNEEDFVAGLINDGYVE